ncbi:UNVERIFIED_CONTAM: hypothetical protein GTU68_032958 [Idotea baltica]|nr:hypothetical protein [Idotea baltica]
MEGGRGGYGYNQGMNGGGGWNQGGGNRDMPNLAALGSSLGLGQGGQGQGNVNPLNMGALTMPMLAALSQAGWGLLGNLQQQQNQDGGQGSGGYNQGNQAPQGAHHGNAPPPNNANMGPGGWGSNSGGGWGDGNQGGSWGPAQGRSGG